MQDPSGKEGIRYQSREAIDARERKRTIQGGTIVALAGGTVETRVAIVAIIVGVAIGAQAITCEST